MTARESPILHAVRHAVASQPGVIIHRNNTGVDETRGVRYGLGKGGADLVGLVTLDCPFCGRAPGVGECISDLHGHPVARYLALEVKAPKARQTPEQKLWAAAVEKAGGFYAVVHDVDEALTALRRARTWGDA